MKLSIQKMTIYRTTLLLLAAFLAGIMAIAQVPKPADVFGFEPGADYKLANYKMLMDYYQRLDKASNRVQMVTIGKSVLGKPMYLMMVSSEANMKQLDKWRSISEQLSRAKIDDKMARSLAASGKAIIWIDAGMHASEVASAQMLPELAYRMATEETPEMKKIRDQVVALLMVEMNPDGLDIVADWYKANLGTPFETTQPPWLYHHYVGHDNNRDWFTNNMPETKAVSEVLYNQWYPQIVYNHHQTSPAWTRIFIPPFANPVNPQIHPGVTAGVNMVGTAMASRFAMKKMPGVVSQLRFSMWWNGGMRTVPYYHNQIGILTETAHATPSPRFYPPDSLPKTVGVGVTASTTGTDIFYADPWKGGQSRFRDAVNYMEEASMATLVLAADKREEFLYNIYVMGRDAIESAGKSRPYAYIIPAEQWDKSEAVNLVNMFRQSGVEIHRATQQFQANNVTYPAGSYIIYGAQAFSPYVVDLMEKQVHPNQRLYPGGPPIPPYDLAGWTLPMQMGVTGAKTSATFKADTELLKGFAPVVAGQVASGAGYGYALSRNQNASVKAVNRLLKDGEIVSFMPSEAGSFLIEKGASTDARIQALAKELGVSFTAVASKPSGTSKPLKLPKIGLYKSWVANMDEGWTRWLMEQYSFPVDTLHDADIAKKDLSTYSAIIIPDQESKRILNGHAPNTMPTTYVGGLGLGGTMALQQYVANGGTLVAFDGASDFAIELFGLPVKNVTEGLSSQQFYIPGSLIRTVVDTKHSLAYGMQPEVAAAFSNSRAFEVIKQSREGEGGTEQTKVAPNPNVEVIASYAKKDLLMSGWALNEDKYIAGKPAVVRVQQGKGNVVMFGFSPQFRGQPRGTYKLIFNALYESTLPKSAVESNTKSE
ncbi:M14 family metallopeptidase [Spirosoma sp.]|uniref:M14 family metallopeptidase n=1 Tax=Spirosoma sp. TaxID=1899569 RepID=UPI003B3B65B8